MEGVGGQDTCGAPTVHDHGIGESEGESFVRTDLYYYTPMSSLIVFHYH